MRRRHRAPCLALAVWITACASASRFEEHRAAHPEWDPSAFPAARSTIDETLASLSRPGPDRTTRRISPIRSWKAASGEWTAIDLHAAGRELPGDVLVSTTLNCLVRKSGWAFPAVRRVWYLFLDGQLAAYDHFECSGDPRDMLTERFARVPAAHAWLEQRALSQLGVAPEEDAAWSWGCRSQEAFLRGVAYAEKGRTDDAKRMLDLGDRIAAQSDRAPDPSAIRRSCRLRASEVREGLVGALARQASRPD